MTFAQWYVALFATIAGVSIGGFWIFIMATRRLEALIPDRPIAVWHVAAEFLTAALLLAAGSAGFVDPDARSTLVLQSVALGAALYALIGSHGFYAARPLMRAALLAGTVSAIPAVVLLFAER